jgi:hypothetical protein
MKISRMLADGEIISLRRGLYLQDRTANPLGLAASIYGPSYVSFETALAWHGLIPERVVEILSATTKRPATFETPVARYRYLFVPARVFSIGIERIDDPLLPWLVASPTKALCDCIARESKLRSQKDVRAWLASMRIDHLPDLDVDQMEACAEHYQRPAVRLFHHYTSSNLP